MTRCVFLCSNMESDKQIQINLHSPGFAYGFHGIQFLFDIVLYFELSLMRLRYMWLVNPHLTVKPYWWLMVMHIYDLFLLPGSLDARYLSYISLHCLWSFLFSTTDWVDTVILKRFFLYGWMPLLLTPLVEWNIDWKRINFHTAT